MLTVLPSSILSSLQQGIIVLSPDRVVLYTNPKFCALLHPELTPADMIGQSGKELVSRFKDVFMQPEEFMDRVHQIYAHPEPIHGEVVRMRDGRLLSRDYQPIFDGDQVQAHIWVYQEFSSRLGSEELDVQRVLNHFISSLYEKETEEEILWDLTRNCIAQLDFIECVVYMLDEESGVLIQRAAWGPKAPEGNVIENYLELPVGTGIIGLVAQTGKAEIVGDVNQDPRYIPDTFPRGSEITVPIFSRGKVIGIIDSEHPNKYFFEDKHLSVLTTLAAVMGIKITQIRDRQTRQTEIERQRLFYEQILNNIPADIAVFNKEHRYLFVNPQGIRNPELRAWIINKNDEEYCDYRERPYSIFQERRAAFNQAIQTQVQTEWEESLINPSGETENYYRRMFPVVNEQGQVDLVIGYGMNVTAIKQAQAVLQRAKQEAEENAQAKEAFLARVSHELRTPMNGIIGLTDLLLRSELSERQSQYIQLLQQSARSLVAIVNEVLDIEKIGSGKMELHPVVFPLRERMQALLDLCQEPANLRGLELKLHVEDGLSDCYRGDINRISQIIGNLLSNALKFTDQGSIELKVHCIDNQTLCFKIIDTGIGIDAESIDRIFEPFVQAASSGQSPRAGTGLGLTICKELANLMGGAIRVQSTLGTGSSFSLCLPLEAVLEADTVPQALNDNTESGNLIGKRVLLVEDVALNRFLVEAMTAEWGIELEMAENGAEGLKKVRQATYDLVLMDVQMPVMDGVQATRVIRQLSDSSIASIPIVALSANAFDSDRRSYLEAGMNDTLSKPFDSEQLRAVMLRVLSGETCAIQPSLSISTPTAVGLAIDLSYLNRVGNGNPGFVQTMLQSFAESVDESCTEMKEMLKNCDRKAIGEVAHKLKFALGVVGVTTLKDTVAFLEAQGKEGVGEPTSDEEYAQVVKTFVEAMRQLKTEASKERD
jgi:signal transduction histidine kinase/HPt (histidine-containing phosphotransfer) domain-containing protein/ActR/RegA family two-component response regulator